MSPFPAAIPEVVVTSAAIVLLVQFLLQLFPHLLDLCLFLGAVFQHHLLRAQVRTTKINPGLDGTVTRAQFSARKKVKNLIFI